MRRLALAFVVSEVFPSDRQGANVRQILGRPGEVWAPESGANRLVVYRTK